MKTGSEKYFRIAGALVLLGASVIFGALGRAAEMGLAILAGAIALAFANLHKLESFSGAGFKATTRASDATQVELDSPDTLTESSEDRAEAELAKLSPRARHAVRP